MKTFFALSLSCLALSGCFCLEENAFLEPASLEQPQMEALARATFPPGALVTHHGANSFGPDRAIWLRMTLPTEQVQPFLDDSGHSVDAEFTLGGAPQESWWRPAQLHAPRSARRQGPGFVSWIAVGQEDAPTQTLYLFAHEL